MCRKRNGSIRFTASLGGLEGCRKKECPLFQKVERQTKANGKKKNTKLSLFGSVYTRVPLVNLRKPAGSVHCTDDLSLTHIGF